MIWKSIPSQLARENKKFIYKVVKEGARAREYEDALQWLVDARLVHKIYRSSAPGLPIAAYDDLSAFKIYLVDVGLLRRLAQLAPTAFGEGNRLFTEFKGALTENFVLQTLITQFEVMPRYWSQNNPPYEVDFLVQQENDIFPVEVKSEANTTSKSMKKFKELFPDKVKLRIRFSLDNLKLDDDVLNIPLFMADQADRLIGLALEKRKHWCIWLKYINLNWKTLRRMKWINITKFLDVDTTTAVIRVEFRLKADEKALWKLLEESYYKDGVFTLDDDTHNAIVANFYKLFELTVYAVNPKNPEEKQVKKHKELKELFPFHIIPAERLLGEDGTQNSSLSALISDFFDMSEDELDPSITKKVKELRSIVENANKSVQQQSIK